MPVQIADLNVPVGPALEFTLPDETWTIDTGITVSAQSGDAVTSPVGMDGSTLINNGNIVGGNAGASFNGDNAEVTNNAGHNIIGASVGLSFKGDGATVTNHGLIGGFAEAGIFFDATSDNVMLTNTGEIFGREIGVGAISDNDGGTIKNFGMIRSDGVGLAVVSSSGEATTITNGKAGTIAGGDFAIPGGVTGAIFSATGRIDLTNKGTIDGDVILMAPEGPGVNVNDKIVNMGKILGEVHLGDGNDVFVGRGGSKVSLFGEADNDWLVASRGQDRLDGGEGNDILTGHRGKDFQTGGTGTDRFDFNSIKDSLKGAKRDMILDFDRSEDLIDVRGIDARMGTSGNQKFKWIGKQDFHDKEGELRYVKKGENALVQGDVNGDGRADFEVFLRDVSALTKGDFLL